MNSVILNNKSLKYQRFASSGCKYIGTRLLGRFAPIYLNCEHVLFVYILKQRRKKFCRFKKKLRIFKNFNFFTKSKTFKTHFLKIVIIHKPTNKQTNPQTSQIYM